MARKAKKKTSVKRGPERRVDNRRIDEFWSKVENAFKRFGKASNLI